MVCRQIINSSLLTLLLAGCALTPLETRDATVTEGVQQALRDAQGSVADSGQPPESVNNALLPSIGGYGPADSQIEERFEVFVDNVPARSFFMGLVKDTSYNMVVHPGVQGDISLELRNVSVMEVMDVLREVYGYPYKKRGNLIQVLPGGLQSEVFKIDYLSLKRRGSSETRVSAGQVTSAGSSNSGGSNNSNSSSQNNSSGGSNSVSSVGTLIETTTDADFWGELDRTLKLLIGTGEGRNVVVTPQAGVIVVRADAAELEVVRDYLRSTEMIMRRQVVLEAKILEVQLSDGYQSGINWTALSNLNGNALKFGIGGTSPVAAAGGVFGISFDANDFTGVIQLLETQGNVQVLSSPRISTVNNQQAVIKVGSDEFFVTQVSNTTTTSSGTTTSSPEIELTPFFSGIALDVTPQISDNNEIILHIHPSISEVKDQVKVVSLGDSVIELPLALSTIRETDSIVSARSGEVVVLGGLMQDTTIEDNSGMPGLADIPLLGHLFTQERNKSVKSELIILLKPIIIGADGLPETLDQSAKRFDQFRDAMEPVYFGRQ
ncbi:MAG: MSHA biogenesis protein MshL [Pseudohongiellaceae bacterium]|jgi:MSHA biogenesis protein MshL